LSFLLILFFRCAYYAEEASMRGASSKSYSDYSRESFDPMELNEVMGDNWNMTSQKDKRGSQGTSRYGNGLQWWRSGSIGFIFCFDSYDY
jgi:hypothetical protein